MTKLYSTYCNIFWIRDKHFRKSHYPYPISWGILFIKKEKLLQYVWKVNKRTD